MAFLLNHKFLVNYLLLLCTYKNRMMAAKEFHQVKDSSFISVLSDASEKCNCNNDLNFSYDLWAKINFFKANSFKY